MADSPLAVFEEGDDFYAILNISRDASSEDIRRAYRQMCVLYHPDKHRTDELRELAREMFPKVQQAFEVLSDEQRRAVYDLYGVEGVTTGSELAPYYNTVAELKADCEMQAKQREHEQQLYMASPQGKMTLNVDARDVFSSSEDSYVDDDETGETAILNLMQNVFISGMQIEQSVQSKITEKDTLRFDGFVVAQDARAGGSIITTWQRHWSEVLQTETTLAMGQQRFYRFKAQRSLGRSSYAFAEATVHEIAIRNHSGYAAGINLGAFRALAPSLFGGLQWRIGLDSAMVASLAFDNRVSRGQFEFSVGSENVACNTSWTHPLTDDTKFKISLKAGLAGGSLGYAIKHKISEHTDLSLSLVCHNMDGVVVSLGFETLRQSYTMPVYLSDSLALDAVAVGGILPVAAFFAFKHLVLAPWQRQQDRMQRQQKRERYHALVAKRKKEAHAAVLLMKETVDRRIKHEEEIGGLVIEEAFYGQLTSTGGAAHPELALDVRIPLQCLVRNSQLLLNSSTKASIVGFYDPCPEEPKHLRVVYRFQGREHHVTIADDEDLRMPLKSHAV